VNGLGKGGLAIAFIAGIGMVGLATAQPVQPAQPLHHSSAGGRGPADGEGLYKARCGYCHLPGGTGTMMLERRLGEGHGLLAERTDLPADYVKAVARNGLNSMPTITPVEVTDEELERIAAYLATADKSRAPAP